MNILPLLRLTASGLICLFFQKRLSTLEVPSHSEKLPENSGPARQSSSNDMLPCWTGFKYLEIDKVLSIRKIRVWGGGEESALEKYS